MINSGGVVIAVCVVAAASVVVLYPDRLSVIGTYAQYHGDFGLSPYRSSAAMKGGLPMSIILVAGTAFLLARLYFWRTRRS